MDLDNYYVGTTLILLFIFLSAMGSVAIRKVKGIRIIIQHHEIIGYFFPIAGGIYGILLGLVVVNSIAMFDAARDTVNAEATDLMSIYTLANSLPEARRTRIQALCKEYVKEVIDNEWVKMDQQAYHPPARELVLRLYDEILQAAEKNDNIGQSLLDVARSMWENRRHRLDIAARNIPDVEWIALCLGGILIILFSYSLVTDSIVVQVTGNVMLSSMIALNIYLVLLFGSPFSGDLHVSNFPFANAMATFKDIDSYHLRKPR